MKTDPQEKDPRYKAIFDEVESILSERYANELANPEMGFCHVYWDAKQRLLHQRGIVWQSPSDLDPDTLFD